MYQWTGNHFEISNKYGIDNTTRLNNIVDDDGGNTYFKETNGALKIWNGATVVEISTDAPLISFHKFPSGDIICKSTNRKFYVIENQHLKPYRFDKYSPQTDWTSNLFDATYYSEDKEKNLWFLTNQYGIGRLSRGKLNI
ncbi:MAG: hypothetical protein H6629_21460 [Calditrichae bacterium]|nr:hypothetical protein [Calditrichia bacterium]